jgi:hypothetical protein
VREKRPWEIFCLLVQEEEVLDLDLEMDIQ